MRYNFERCLINELKISRILTKVPKSMIRQLLLKHGPLFCKCLSYCQRSDVLKWECLTHNDDYNASYRIANFEAIFAQSISSVFSSQQSKDNELIITCAKKKKSLRKGLSVRDYIFYRLSKSLFFSLFLSF